jgi:IS5 family transposase
VDDNGLILAVHTTAANEHDSRRLSPLLEKLPGEELEGGVLADKGYQVPANNTLLKERGIKNRLMHKADRNRPLTHWQAVFNKLIGKSRWGGTYIWKYQEVAQRWKGALRWATEDTYSTCFTI